MSEEEGIPEEEIEDKEVIAEEKVEEEEEEDSEFMFTSIEDIELLVKNTEVWDSLLQGKITIEQAKKVFEENLALILKSEKGRKKSKKSKVTKKGKKSKGKKKKEEEIEEEENV